MAYGISLGAIAGSVLVMLHRGGDVSAILQVGGGKAGWGGSGSGPGAAAMPPGVLWRQARRQQLATTCNNLAPPAPGPPPLPPPPAIAAQVACILGAALVLFTSRSEGEGGGASYDAF